MIENTAMVAAIDELEKLGGQERDKLQKTLRTSSRGGKIAKGTSNQRGRVFGLQHIVWCGAIETGLQDAADLNRYIILSLSEVHDYAGRPVFQLPSEADLKELGQRCLALAMHVRREVAEMAEQLRTAQNVRPINRRVKEAYALPVALIGVISGFDVHQTGGMLESILDDRNVHGQDISDESALMAAIMQASVWLKGGGESTVSSLIDTKCSAPDGTNALQTRGVMLTGSFNTEGGRRLFLLPELVSQKLLKGTRFADLRIQEILLRIPGARVSQKRMGTIRPRGVSIPLLTALDYGSASDDVQSEPDDDELHGSF